MTQRALPPSPLNPPRSEAATLPAARASSNTEHARAEAAAVPIPAAQRCGDRDHFEELEYRGITYGTTCPVCAFDTATTDGYGSEHERRDVILDWAFDYASIGPRECEELARCAVESPAIFLARWQLAELRAQQERLEICEARLRQIKALAQAAIDIKPTDLGECWLRVRQIATGRVGPLPAARAGVGR